MFYSVQVYCCVNDLKRLMFSIMIVIFVLFICLEDRMFFRIFLFGLIVFEEVFQRVVPETS